MDTITKAVDHGTYIMLTLQPAGEKPYGDEPYPYALYDNDPYGDAPALRAELQRMVDDGEITVEPHEPEPEPEPEPEGS